MFGSILVINNRHIGDVLMASAAVRLLRSCSPQSRITLTVPPATIPLVNDPALVDEVVPVPSYKTFRSFQKTLDALRLRFRHYDACFYFGESATNAKRLQWLSGIPVRVCASLDLDGSPSKAAPFCTDVVPTGSVWTGHVVDWFQDIVRGYFQSSGRERPSLAPLPDVIPPAVENFFQTSGPHVGVCFHGSPTGLSSWPEASAAALVKRLSSAGCQLFMACPPNDVEKALRIRETSGVPIFIKGTSIPECVSMLRRADLLVSVDTGQVHIAAALGTPVLSLAGSTLTGTYPYSEKGLAIGCARNCHDCSFISGCSSNRKHGKRHAAGYVPPCMAAIDAESAYRYALRLLETPCSSTRYQVLETSGSL